MDRPLKLAWVKAAAILLTLALVLCACGAGNESGAGPRMELDGAPWAGGALAPEAGDLRVYVTLDGAPLADLPFGEAHTLVVRQPDGSENAVRLTGEAAYMESANCDNQDCVNMGEVTRENLELRVMGGFIICLPHKISVEVRD